MSNLPECEYRVDIDRPERYYCRHQKVHANQNLVSAEVCRSCPYCNLPCAEPRPLPTPEDLIPRPAPSLGQQLWSFAKSVADFIADGMKTVSPEEYAERLAICDECPERQGNRCLQCGCRLSIKAKGRAFQCPLGKWPVHDSSTEGSDE